MAKLIKKITAVQGERNDYEFVRDEVKVKALDYTLQADEEEVTELNYLTALLSTNQIGIKAYRRALKRIEENKSVANMSVQEVQASSNYLALSNVADQFSAMPNIWDRIHAGCENYHEKSVKDRVHLFRFASSIIYNTVLPDVATTIINRIVKSSPPDTGGSMWLHYVEFGREGTVQGNPVGIMDYVNSVVGTEFENNGLREALTGNVIPNTLTIDEIIEAVNMALVDGIKLYK